MSIVPTIGDRRPARGVYIFDDDALDKLGALEGASWRAEQDARPDSPYGFHAWLRAWQAKRAAVAGNAEYADEPVSSFMEGGDGAIYGAGGYHRFLVMADGELALSRWSASAEWRGRARAAGFTIS